MTRTGIIVSGLGEDVASVVHCKCIQMERGNVEKWRSGEGEQLQKPESVNQYPSASAGHEMQVINFDV